MISISRVIPSLLLLVCLVLAAAVPSAVHAQGPRFDLVHFTLANGLETVILPNHRAPVVLVQVFYKVGAADGPPGKNGAAHFLEHLMFKGTARYPDGAFDRLIQSHGGESNASTNQDVTEFHEVIPKDQLKQVLDIEADRMEHLTLDDATVLPERDVIIEERRQRIDNDPGAQLAEAENAALYLNSPYRLPVIGWLHEMKQYTTQDALDFYRHYYAPNNAVLVLAGDVTPQEARGLVEKHFAALARRDIPRRQRLVEPPHRVTTQVSFRSPLAHLPSIGISFLAPSYRTATGNDAYALQVLREVLSGDTGLLYEDMVIDKKVAAGVGARYSPRPYDVSSFGLWAATNDEKQLDGIRERFMTITHKIALGGVTREELANAKKRLLIAVIKTRADLTGPADIVGTGLATDRSLLDIQNWPTFIEAVTNDDIKRAAQSVFSVPGVESRLLPGEQ